MMADLWWQWLGLWFSAFSSATILPGTSDVVLVAMVNAHPQWWAWAWLVANRGQWHGRLCLVLDGALVAK